MINVFALVKSLKIQVILALIASLVGSLVSQAQTCQQAVRRKPIEQLRQEIEPQIEKIQEFFARLSPHDPSFAKLRRIYTGRIYRRYATEETTLKIVQDVLSGLWGVVGERFIDLNVTGKDIIRGSGTVSEGRYFVDLAIGNFGINEIQIGERSRSLQMDFVKMVVALGTLAYLAKQQNPELMLLTFKGESVVNKTLESMLQSLGFKQFTTYDEFGWTGSWDFGGREWSGEESVVPPPRQGELFENLPVQWAPERPGWRDDWSFSERELTTLSTREEQDIATMGEERSNDGLDQAKGETWLLEIPLRDL